LDCFESCYQKTIGIIWAFPTEKAGRAFALAFLLHKKSSNKCSIPNAVPTTMKCFLYFKIIKVIRIFYSEPYKENISQKF
jgi:hypothetical protein